MTEQLYTYEKVKSLVETSVAMKLLRYKHFALLFSFLNATFKKSDSYSIPYQVVVQKLAEYLEFLRFDEGEPDVGSIRMAHDFAQTHKSECIDYQARAEYYINQWIEQHFLRNVFDEELKQPVVFLTRHTEKVFQIVELMRDKDFVGTESRFLDLFNKLREISDNANPDTEKRLEELTRRRKEIDDEIKSITIDGRVRVYEDYQIQSRFDEVNRIAGELIGDFKEVEDNFKDITRKIYENQQQSGLTKGQMLTDTFDAIFTLKHTNQGKSFYAFWQFMLDDLRQMELKNLTREVYTILEDRNLPVPNRSLRTLKTSLHLAARRVLEKNTVLADKLSREVVARDQLENRKIRETINSIRQLALKAVQTSLSRDTWMMIDGNPDVSLPMERRLGNKPEINTSVVQADIARFDLADLQDLDKLIGGDVVNKVLLLDNIKDMLDQQEQVTLRQVVEEKGLEHGLAELLAYISLVNTNSKFFINDVQRDIIIYDQSRGKCLDLPQVIYSR